MGISFFVFYGITGINPLKELKIISIIPLFFISLVISSIMTLAVYPFIINIMNKTIQSYQKEHNIANKISKSIYDLTIFNQKYKHSFVYIFDFEDQFIESGNAYMLSEKNDKIQIAISTETGRIKSKFTIDKILAEFNSKERDADSADLIVDLERKLKIFVFYS